MLYLPVGFIWPRVETHDALGLQLLHWQSGYSSGSAHTLTWYFLPLSSISGSRSKYICLFTLFTSTASCSSTTYSRCTFRWCTKRCALSHYSLSLTVFSHSLVSFFSFCLLTICPLSLSLVRSFVPVSTVVEDHSRNGSSWCPNDRDSGDGRLPSILTAKTQLMYTLRKKCCKTVLPLSPYDNHLLFQVEPFLAACRTLCGMDCTWNRKGFDLEPKRLI